MPKNTTPTPERWWRIHGGNFIIGLIVMVVAVFALDEVGVVYETSMFWGLMGTGFGGVSGVAAVFAATDKGRPRFPVKDALSAILFLAMSFVVLDISIRLMGGGIIAAIIGVSSVFFIILFCIVQTRLKLPKPLVLFACLAFAAWQINLVVLGDWHLELIDALLVDDEGLGYVFADLWMNIRGEGEGSWRDFERANTVLHILEPVWLRLYGAWESTRGFLIMVWASIPLIVRIAVLFAMLSGCVGIVYSHVRPITKQQDNWLKHTKQDLMFSYFTETGKHMMRSSYAESRAMLLDNTYIFTISGLTHRLGNVNHASKLVTFIIAIPYVLMLMLAMIEMTTRVVLGTVYLIVMKITHRLILVLTNHITYLIVPIAMGIERVMCKKRSCPHCSESFNLPAYVCPACKKVHSRLVPSRSGILFAKCECNKWFLPTMKLTGRSNLQSNCPNAGCGKALTAAYSYKK